MRRRKDSGDACALAPARGTVRAAGRGGGRGGTTGTQGAGCAFDSAQPQRRDADRGRESYQSVSVTAAGGLRVDYTSVSGVYIHTHLALRERDHHDVWDVQPEHPNSGLARGPQYRGPTAPQNPPVWDFAQSLDSEKLAFPAVSAVVAADWL